MTDRLLLVALALALAACGGTDGAGQLAGEELAAEVGCLSCHQETSTGMAPTLHGVWGRMWSFRTAVQ